MLESLKNALERGQSEVEIGEYLTELTADIISKTEFGTSYKKGKQIFYLLTQLQSRCALATRNLLLPGSRYVNLRMTSVFLPYRGICEECHMLMLNKDS